MENPFSKLILAFSEEKCIPILCLHVKCVTSRSLSIQLIIIPYYNELIRMTYTHIRYNTITCIYVLSYTFIATVLPFIFHLIIVPGKVSNNHIIYTLLSSYGYFIIRIKRRYILYTYFIIIRL